MKLGLFLMTALKKAIEIKPITTLQLGTDIAFKSG
jgi:hypothetical protein